MPTLMFASFVLAFILGILWAISGVRGDYITWGIGDNQLSVRSDRGYLVLLYIHAPYLPSGVQWETDEDGGYAGQGYGPPTSNFAVFDVVRFTRGQFAPILPTHPTGTYSLLSTSYAVPVALLAISPIIWWSPQRRRRRLVARRIAMGLCPACGYDLRGISSPRCPECGEQIASAAGAAGANVAGAQ